MHHHITSETSNHSASSTFSNYEWHSATGPLAIPMTNDYLFRALLQTNSYVLKGLIGALLHLAPWEIISATINNPIQLGESIDDKSFLLDVSVTLNNCSLINLEMQVINEHNWPERSLSVTVQPFGCPVTESGHFEFCLRQKGRILCRLYIFVRTLQQVQSPWLNCYP